MVRLGSAAKSTFGGLPADFWWLWISTLVNRIGGFVLPFFAFYVTGPLHRSAAFAGAVAALASVVFLRIGDQVGRRVAVARSAETADGEQPELAAA